MMKNGGEKRKDGHGVILRKGGGRIYVKNL